MKQQEVWNDLTGEQAKFWRQNRMMRMAMNDESISMIDKALKNLSHELDRILSKNSSGSSSNNNNKYNDNNRNNNCDDNEHN